MKIIHAATLAILAVMNLWSIASGMSHPPSEGAITLDGRLNYPYISSSGGRAYLQLAITTSDFRISDRRPMNISVVLDRSGSMADEGKIEYAKKALYTLIDQLSSDDILSIVIYDDVIEVLSRAKKVRNRTALKRLIERIEPRGSTNLGGGMVEGFHQVERNLDKEYVNRVILISDGLANQGITDPRALNRIAKQYRSKYISLTAMGVGLDYNENLMVGLSESGGGNYYFIESPYNLASLFRKELNTLSRVVAQNASIELTLGRGVRVIDVIGCEHRFESSRYVIPVGDLYENERREFTVELEIPEGRGSLTAATGILYADNGDARVRLTPAFSSVVRYTDDISLIEKSCDLEVQAKADVAVSTRSVERAMQALDEGRAEEAVKELAGAKQMLSISPAASSAGAGGPVIREQEAKLESYQDMLKNSPADARKAKKSIQYDNYKTQKNK